MQAIEINEKFKKCKYNYFRDCKITFKYRDNVLIGNFITTERFNNKLCIKVAYKGIYFNITENDIISVEKERNSKYEKI